MLAFGWLTLLPVNTGLGKHSQPRAGFVSNFALWSEAGYFDAPPHSKPLLHLWSLGIEEQFYLLWPLLLWRSRWRRRALPLTRVRRGDRRLRSTSWRCRHPPIAAFYSPARGFWELMVGAILALTIARDREL